MVIIVFTMGAENAWDPFEAKPPKSSCLLEILGDLDDFDLEPNLPLHFLHTQSHHPAQLLMSSSGPLNSHWGLSFSPVLALGTLPAAMETDSRVTKGGCWALFLPHPVDEAFQISKTEVLYTCQASLRQSLKWNLYFFCHLIRTMSTSLTTCEWKKVFYEKMEVAKPADSWELIMDPNLKPNELAPGWKQYVEQHASGR